METNEIQKLVTETTKASNAGLKLLDRVFTPWNAKRSADAKAQDTVQTALAQRLSDLIEGDQLSPDAYDILATCGGKMSVVNLANTLSKALPMLDEGADPSLVSDDWIANWRDKARVVSDEDMILLWAQLLVSEANSPGSKSRKAVNVLADLEPEDAKLFRALCNFRLSELRNLPITFPGAPPPPRSRFNTAPNPPLLVVVDPRNELYSAKGVDFASLGPFRKLGTGEGCAARIPEGPWDNYLDALERVFDLDSRIARPSGSGISNDVRVPAGGVMRSFGIA